MSTLLGLPARAANAVASVLAAAPTDLPPPVPTPDDVERTIDDILSGAEYQPPPRNPIERLRDWVFEQISELLADAFGGGAGSVISIVVLALASAVLVYFLVKMVRGVRSDAVQRMIEEAEVGRPSEAWLADAQAHERRGAWRDALRCRYRALVAELAARGLVDEIPGRTTGEYRREVASNLPTAAPEFSGASELFDLAWYGDVPTGPAENQRFRALSERVVAEARG